MSKNVLAYGYSPELKKYIPLIFDEEGRLIVTSDFIRKYPLYEIKTIDLSSSRANSQIDVSGCYLKVLDATGYAEIKVGDYDYLPAKPNLELPVEFSKLLLRNYAQQGAILKLLIMKSKIPEVTEVEKFIKNDRFYDPYTEWLPDEYDIVFSADFTSDGNYLHVTPTYYMCPLYAVALRTKWEKSYKPYTFEVKIQPTKFTGMYFAVGSAGTCQFIYDGFMFAFDPNCPETGKTTLEAGFVAGDAIRLWESIQVFDNTQLLNKWLTLRLNIYSVATSVGGIHDYEIIIPELGVSYRKTYTTSSSSEVFTNFVVKGNMFLLSDEAVESYLLDYLDIKPM